MEFNFSLLLPDSFFNISMDWPELNFTLNMYMLYLACIWQKIMNGEGSYPSPFWEFNIREIVVEPGWGWYHGNDPLKYQVREFCPSVINKIKFHVNLAH